MKSYPVLLTVSIGLASFFTGAALKHYFSAEPSVKPAREFLCEDDGKLVERHIDVAYVSYMDNGEWRIRYTDGAQYYYHQDEGETCYVEEVR